MEFNQTNWTSTTPSESSMTINGTEIDFTTIIPVLKNMSNHYRAKTFSPPVVHFTYYELNFFDIVFIACVFFLKFFITSLFLIFALVAINGNSYPQLLARSSESHRMSTGPSTARRRRDLIFTLATLNIISGNLESLLNYISAIQRFIFVKNCSEKWDHLKAAWFRWIICIRPQTASVRLPLNGQSFAPKVHDSGRLTPHVVFIDSEPGILEEIQTQTPEQPSLDSTPVDYKPVLRIRVQNHQDGTSLIVRARLDPHSICSYISPEIAANLRLRRHFIWPCFFRSFPGRSIKYVYQATSAVLLSMEEPENSTSGPVITEPVELLMSNGSSFGSSPQPSSWIQFLAKNTCGITLSDEVQEPDCEIGLVIGQDLLYKLFLKTDHSHKAFIIGKGLCFVGTAFGWVIQGSSGKVNTSGEVPTCQVETENLGIVEKDYQRRRKCTDTMRILCCPLQILVSLLVLLIYIIIPYIDSLLYLYNILFHLAITFALAQILAFIIGPLLTFAQSLIAWRHEMTFHLFKANIIRTYLLLSSPLLFIYRWFLGAIWVSLYWFLSMGKALFNQWNYSSLESKHSIKFSGNFIVRTLGLYPEDNQTVIHVKLDPIVEQSSISSDLAGSEAFQKLFQETTPKTLENGVNGNWVSGPEDTHLFRIRISAQKVISFKVVEPATDDLEPSWIVIGADLLEATSDLNLNQLIRYVLLFDTHKPGKPIEVCLENPEEPTGPWALEHRFYPHGWLQIITCTYWFNRANFVYLFFFIGYSFLLAIVYFCLIAPYELTLISIHPTMFRYIGNFLFYSSRWI